MLYTINVVAIILQFHYLYLSIVEFQLNQAINFALNHDFHIFSKFRICVYKNMINSWYTWYTWHLRHLRHLDSCDICDITDPTSLRTVPVVPLLPDKCVGTSNKLAPLVFVIYAAWFLFNCIWWRSLWILKFLFL